MSKLSVFVSLALFISAAVSLPMKVNSLYPGSYYQPKAESLVARRHMPQVDRYFESFDSFGREEDEFEDIAEDEEPALREIEDEPEPTGRELKEETSEVEVPNASETSRFIPQSNHFEPKGREIEEKREKFNYGDEESAASNIGYFRGYAPRSIVLTDDTAFEARFPFPVFPKLDFPFDKPFQGK